MKTYRIRVSASAANEKVVAGTIPELSMYFGNMLETAKKKNTRVNCKPRGIHQLVQNLYRASLTLDMPYMNYWVVSAA